MHSFMKIASLFVLVVAAMAMISGCASKPPPAPGDKAFSGADALAYRRGYHHGFQDAKHRLDEDFERYHDEYKDVTAKVFEHGYTLGYEAGRGQAEVGEQAGDEAFNQGFELGQSDNENALSPQYQRHQGVFTPATEGSFKRGYVLGFKEARRE